MLRRLSHRLALQQWAQFSVTALLCAACAGIGWVLLTRLFPVFGNPGTVSVALFVVAFAGAAGWAVYRRPSLVKAAVLADKRLGLKERLSSSLEMEGVEGPMIGALHDDARSRLEGLDYTKSFPLAPPRVLRWVGASLIVFALVYALFPQLDLLGYEEKVAEAKVKKDAISLHVERVKEAATPASEDALEVSPVLADVAAKVEALADDLNGSRITEKQALAELAKLTDELQKHRDAMQQQAKPKMAGDLNKLNMAKELAKALQDGRMDDAVKQAQELKEKLARGDMSLDDMAKLSSELDSLAAMLGGDQSELGAALSKALSELAAAMKSGDEAALAEAMKAMEMAMEDMESILAQMQQMDGVMANLGQWKNSLLGPSDYCRFCGAKLIQCDGGGECDGGAGHSHSGVCGSCAGAGAGAGVGTGLGLGLGGAGRGTGNQVGELPEVQVGFLPTKATGPLTKGQMLADILQKAAPEEGAEAHIEYLSGAFVEAVQAAEKALSQQEIPPGSKEYVRQYFLSLEPEDD
jgi:hypothetical protein